MNQRSDFAAAIRAARERQGISIREVARRGCGSISTTTIQNMEAGHVPSVDLIVAYAEALETEPEGVRLLADALLTLADKPFRYHPMTRCSGSAGAGDQT